MNTPDSFVLDPSPQEWFTEARQKKIELELLSSFQLLTDSGCVDDVILYWIRRELSYESPSDKDLNQWSRKQWGHRIDQLFLEYKNDLDKVSCKLIRVSDNGVALELYQRLVNNEVGFAETSSRFGEGPERFSGGLIKLQPIEQYNGNLIAILRKLKPLEVSKPWKIGEKFFIIQLIDYVPAKRDKEAEAYVLSKRLSMWVSGMSSYLKNFLQKTSVDSNS